MAGLRPCSASSANRSSMSCGVILAAARGDRWRAPQLAPTLRLCAKLARVARNLFWLPVASHEPEKRRREGVLRVLLHDCDPMIARQSSPKFVSHDQASDATAENHNVFGAHRSPLSSHCSEVKPDVRPRVVALLKLAEVCGFALSPENIDTHSYAELLRHLVVDCGLYEVIFIRRTIRPEER